MFIHFGKFDTVINLIREKQFLFGLQNVVSCIPENILYVIIHKNFNKMTSDIRIKTSRRQL